MPLAAAGAIIGAPLAAAPVAAPRVLVASFDRLPYPYPCTATADGKAQVAAARAAKTHKRLLIDFGGNWCLDCRLLAGVMDLPSRSISRS